MEGSIQDMKLPSAKAAAIAAVIATVMATARREEAG